MTVAFSVTQAHHQKMTPAQCRAARGLIRWTQPDLANAAGVSDVTVRKFENEQGAPQRASLQVMRAALESAGVIFVAENGEGPGVRLRKKQETAADLTHRIDTIENNLAETKGPSPKTPAGGMQRLERAHKREAVTKLKNRRTKLGKT